ncbi:MAG TPA: pyridoxal-dependent decarboxylase [Candidatus Acidoferrales bacterium]|jgi:glutamate/tyrosine decarboxylase-like PLP-dependent enzyme|nr:pyridoxal-dependent decarboxylase [Candidatus Acidoferrales bacterium]
MAKIESQFKQPLDQAFRAAISYIENLDNSPVAATVDLQTLRERLGKPLTDEGAPAERVVAELVHDAEEGLIGTSGGRFFAWVIGGSIPAALAADWISSVWDQNASIYATSPAAAVIEEVVGKWLKEILGLPPHASFALVTGCQMAHTTCLAAARYALLEKHGWDIEEKGLYGAPRIRILSSGMRHGTFARAIRLLGFGKSQVKILASDSQDRLVPEALEQEFQRDSQAPTIVLLQAGDINIGAYDPFEKLIPIAKRHGAWVHVDGAFGLWAQASPKFRRLTRGVDQADSWATDGHKWLNVPYDCGYAFVADANAHKRSMTHRAPYLVHEEGARDEMDWNPEWSRRARGFPTYAALRQLGRKGVRDIVESCCKHARSIVMGIGGLTGAEVVWEPVINQGLVRFLDPTPGATEEAHDGRTDKIIAAINATGEAFFCGTTWRGRRAMRVSVSSWMTSDEDVRRTIQAVANVLNA